MEIVLRTKVSVLEKDLMVGSVHAMLYLLAPLICHTVE